MNTAISADGTAIAYERIGSGPAIVLVDGALCHRDFGPARPMAEALSEHFTVYIYDRRGRNASGDTQPYTPEREVEDLRAVAEAADEPVSICTFSSGAAMALPAVTKGMDVKALVIYEFPLIVDDSRLPAPVDFLDRQRASIAAGKPGDAVKRFMRFVGMPAPMVALFPLLPVWSKLKKVAHTLPYDAESMGDGQSGKPVPSGKYDDVKVPTLVIAGGKSPAWMRNANASLAKAIPNAEHCVLPGQTHMIKPKALAPVLIDHLR